MKQIKWLFLLSSLMITQGLWANGSQSDCKHEKVEYVPEKPNCIEEGHSAYYHCFECGTLAYDKEFTDVIGYIGYTRTYASGHEFNGTRCEKCGLEIQALSEGDNEIKELRRFFSLENWYDWDFFAFESKSTCYLTATLQNTYGCEFALIDKYGEWIELNNENVASAPVRRAKGNVQTPIDHIAIGKGWYYIGIKNMLADNVTGENLFIEAEEMEPLHLFDEDGHCTHEGCSATLEYASTRYNVSTISVPTEFTKFYQIDVRTEGSLSLIYRASDMLDLVFYNEDWIAQKMGYEYDEYKGIHSNWLSLLPGTYYFAYRSEKAEVEVDLETWFNCYNSMHDCKPVDAKDPTCLEPGWKEHYICGICGRLFVMDIWGGLEERNFDLEESGLLIPISPIHDIDKDGNCTICHKKAELFEGETAEVIFPAGFENITTFKFTATESKLLEVSVLSAARVYETIMLWGEWLDNQIKDDDSQVEKAPRRAGKDDEDKEPIVPQVFYNKVVAGTAYAIELNTSGEYAEPATITLTYVDYPQVGVGNNSIVIDEVSGEPDDDPQHYNIFKFVAPASGLAHFYTTGDEDLCCMLFDKSFSYLEYNDGTYENYRTDIDFTYPVEKGKTYYLGVRQAFGYSIENYTLSIEIEALPEFEGTLELAAVGDDLTVTEKGLVPAVLDFFGDNIPELNSPYFVVNDGVTYKRNPTTSKWGTVVLPYELTSNEKVAYYELTEADIPNSTLGFTKVETVAPNTPTVFRIISGNQYDASVEGPVVIELPEDFGDFNLYIATKVYDWYMDGWYVDAVIDTQKDDYFLDKEGNPGDPGILYISGDKFYHAMGTVTMKPYRAIFEAYNVDWSSGANHARALTITFDDDNSEQSIQTIMGDDGEFIDIEGIYDLSGRKIRQFQKGFNIYRTPDGKNHKMFNY